MKTKVTKKEQKFIKQKYAFDIYKPNANAVPVEYNGTQYLSKAQCMALEGITRKELDEYLKSRKESENSVVIEG